MLREPHGDTKQDRLKGYNCFQREKIQSKPFSIIHSFIWREDFKTLITNMFRDKIIYCEFFILFIHSLLLREHEVYPDVKKVFS